MSHLRLPDPPEAEPASLPVWAQQVLTRARREQITESTGFVADLAYAAFLCGVGWACADLQPQIDDWMAGIDRNVYLATHLSELAEQLDLWAAGYSFDGAAAETRARLRQLLAGQVPS